MYANTTEERIEYKSIVWPLLDWGAPFPEAADFEMISRDVTANYGCSMVSTPKAKFDPLTDVIFILYIHFQEMRLVKTKRKTKRTDVSLQEILLLLTSYVFLSVCDDSHICATHFLNDVLADGTKLPAKKFDSLNRKLFYFCCRISTLGVYV